MRKQLLEAGNEFGNLLRSALEACTEMCKRRYEKPPPAGDRHMDLVRNT